MPWPAIEIFLFFILVAMLQIKKLNYYQPNLFLPFFFSVISLCRVTQPLHSRTLFCFPPVRVRLPSVDLIPKQAHITLEILQRQNVAF